MPSTGAKKKAHLGLVGLVPGAHQTSWRHPTCDAACAIDIEFYRQMVQAAEKAKFDLFFLADGTGGGEERPDLYEHQQVQGQLEPMTLLSALSTFTKNIGLVATMSASANTPYQIARLAGSLDHISRGRAGWNLVTTPNAVEDVLGVPSFSGKEEQYARGEEVLKGVHQFWDSWHENSFQRDKESGTFVTLKGSRPPNLQGKYFRLRGLMNMPRPPQGRPILVQAGASDIGRGFAAKWADLVFTIQPTLQLAQSFYRDVKDRADRAGRDPDTIRIMPGLSVYVGRTRSEAFEFQDEMKSLMDPVAGLAQLAQLSGIDLRGFDLDAKLPEIRGAAAKGFRSDGFRQAFQAIGGDEDLTIRQLLQRISAGWGHVECVGTPEDIADFIEEWIETEGADGLNILVPLFPRGFDPFANLVVPELQRRGRFRTDYEGTTLRDNLDLARPVRS